MGIHGLTKLLSDNCPSCMKDDEIKNYFGRKLAIDASMSLYQFLIAVRPDAVNNLTDESGETTSHLQGLFQRTIRMLKHGIKPVFVFDGKPPEMKSEELAKRREKREAAEEEAKQAKESGDAEALSRFSKRTVKVTKKHVEDAKKLLKLMGIPIVEAPSEAEAQCAALVRAGLVWATGSEDMDAMTFGTPIMLRHLTFSEARKVPIKEIHLDAILEQLKLNMDEFIDLCILLGCDYCDSIRGIGPVRALEMITRYRTLENILKHLDRKKYTVPDNFGYEAARKLFKEPETLPTDQVQLVWKEPDEEGLLQFLVKEKGFSEDRVKSGIEKIKKCRTTSVQDRLTSYFNVVKVEKRKRDEKPAKGAKGAKGKNKVAKGANTKSPRGKP